MTVVIQQQDMTEVFPNDAGCITIRQVCNYEEVIITIQACHVSAIVNGLRAAKKDLDFNIVSDRPEK